MFSVSAQASGQDADILDAGDLFVHDYVGEAGKQTETIISMFALKAVMGTCIRRTALCTTNTYFPPRCPSELNKEAQ